MRYAKYLLAVLAAAAFVAAAAGTASANRFSLSTKAIRTTWSSLEFEASGVTVRCAVTMEGSFHSTTFPKVREVLVGYITRARVHHPCTGGTVWTLTGETNEVLGGTTRNLLPWHARYSSFEGTLPNITGVGFTLINAGYLVSILGLLCEYVSGTEALVILELFYRILGVVIIGYRYITNKVSVTAGCPRMRISGEGTPTVLGTTAQIRLTLI